MEILVAQVHLVAIDLVFFLPFVAVPAEHAAHLVSVRGRLTIAEGTAHHAVELVNRQRFRRLLPGTFRLELRDRRLQFVPRDIEG